ncbi:isochorismatase hydrolase [Nemania sp. FL0916]|nr:isochorismatase hydrolase [Nemania sp. FL0916]
MSKTAIIVLDIQTGIFDRIKDKIDGDQYLSKVSSTLASAREAGVLVIQVTIGFRPSYADASPRNNMIARIREAGLHKDTDASVQLHPRLASAAANDVHIMKRRVSAFHGTDLEVVLRSSGVEKIALAGIATSGAVLSTCRQAFDMDYEVTILADLCADPDAEVHDLLLKKVFLRQATVVDVEEWLAKLEK